MYTRPRQWSLGDLGAIARRTRSGGGTRWVHSRGLRGLGQDCVPDEFVGPLAPDQVYCSSGTAVRAPGNPAALTSLPVFAPSYAGESLAFRNPAAPLQPAQPFNWALWGGLGLLAVLLLPNLVRR